MAFKIKRKKNDTPRRRSVIGLSNEPSSESSSDLFKRNRTLTGTTSNGVNSAGNKNNLESPRVHVHSLSKQRRKISSVLALVVLSALMLWVLVSHLTAYAAVTIIGVTASAPIGTTKYEEAIQDYLDVNPMDRITFFLNQQSMTDFVSNKLPEVSKVKQQGEIGFGRTNFIITMRKPVAGWQINKKQYYVDSDGIAFERNYFSSPLVQIIDNSGVSVSPGSTAVASRSFLGFIGRVISYAKGEGFTVTQAILPINTTRELEVRLKEVTYAVKFSKDRPAGEQAQDMAVTIGHFSKTGRNPQYVDVRVKDKAVYR